MTVAAGRVTTGPAAPAPSGAGASGPAEAPRLAGGVQGQFRQVSPKVLICTDGYRYGGREFDRRAETAQIAAGLPGLEHVIYLSLLHPGDPRPPAGGALRWAEVMDQPAIPAAGFEFEQVPFGHPLWILFSSGTTGLPKAITHSHGGILIEQLKLQTFHMDFRAGDGCSSTPPPAG